MIRTIGFVLASLVATANANCPAAVTAAAKKSFPDATIKKCEADGSHFEVEMQRRDNSIVELSISASGAIEEIEEPVPLTAVPAPVTKAFAARYPKARILSAEKQTKADKSVTFELAFETDKKREVTFKADGTFVEEE